MLLSMKKILFLIILSLFGFTISNSGEKDFEVVGESNRALYLIDVNSVQEDDDYNYIRFKHITSLKKLRKLNDGRNYSSVLITSVADCDRDKRSIKDIEMEFYDGKMDNGDVTRVKLIKKDEELNLPWIEAKTPGKVNTKIVSMACEIRYKNLSKKSSDIMKKMPPLELWNKKRKQLNSGEITQVEFDNWAKNYTN
tara:strand:+ start:164 stop:751 length:588 start_codon:yes stop_codon:yes gene_type:complete